MNKTDSKYWSLIIILLLLSAGAALGMFVHRTTTDISDALAAEVVQQQSDVSLLLFEYDALRLAFEKERLSPESDIDSDRIENAMQSIESRLQTMRFNYSFERLDGAATAHAYVKPIVEDVRYWIGNGVPGVEMFDGQLVAVAATRIMERHDSLRAIAEDTNRVAKELINTQAGYLTRFGESLMFLLAAFAMLAVGIAALLMRQRNLQYKIAVDQHQHAERIKDFADTGADWFWEMNHSLRLRVLSGRSLAMPTAQIRENTPVDREDQLPAFDRDIVVDHWPMELLGARKEFSDYETQWTARDRSVCTISISGKPLFNSNGEFTGYRGIGRDITERKEMERELVQVNRALIKAETRGREQAEQALRDSETFLRTSLNALPQNLAILDTAGIVLEANTAWNESTLIDDSGGVGKHYVDVLFEHLVENTVIKDTVQKINWVLDGNAESLRTEVHVSTEETDAWFSIALSSFESNGNRYSVLAVEEVTDRVLLEEQDRQLRAELAHFSRLTTVGELATGLAHELNQPLTAISHNCDALLSGIENGNAFDSDDLDAIDEMRTEAERAGAIIKGLRKLVRKETADVKPTDINQLVTETMRLSLPDAKKFGINVQLNLADKLLQPHIDAVQIQQVLVNLERNGVEAIRVNDSLRREMIISTQDEGIGFVRVTVQDSGGGFSEEVRDKLFSPFLTTKAGGVGMGLSISRSIIESHGGQLWVDFDDPAMTTFHFTLPI